MSVHAEISEAHAASFQAVRQRLLGIAYGVLGNAAEAADVVQDAWMRWQGTDPSVVRHAPAFLAAATTRLAINVTQSARARHETQIGAWLPERVDAEADGSAPPSTNDFSTRLSKPHRPEISGRSSSCSPAISPCASRSLSRHSQNQHGSAETEMLTPKVTAITIGTAHPSSKTRSGS